MAEPLSQKDAQVQTETRLHQARLQKSYFDIDLREGMFFAAPHRHRNVTSLLGQTNVKPLDAGLLNTAFAMEMSADHLTVMLDTFMPQAVAWARRRPGMAIPDELKSDLLTQIKADDDKIFEVIASSNFYPECGKTLDPDLALGTFAMWIDAGRPARPISCKGIPIRELEINLGPEGEVDDRFVCQYVRNELARPTMGPAAWDKLPPKLQKKLSTSNTRDDKVQIVRGFWRDWSDDTDICWHHTVMVDDAVCTVTQIKGLGACPLIVGRFNPCVEYPWGVGALIKSLPDLRNYDALVEGKIKNIDLMLNPPVTWPDDSFVNVQSGIETGMAYPVRPGSAIDIKNIYEPHPPDAAIYEKQDLEGRIKRLFYLDWPEQRGDTPPTATQWLDMMTMAQRRIGTPGMTFWREFPAEVFMRFAHIMTMSGVIRKALVDNKLVTLMPYNPAQRAQEQQEVASFARFAEIGGQAFPEEWKVQVDGTITLKNLAKKLGADTITAFRKPEDIQGAMQQIQPLLQGAVPGAPPAAAEMGQPGAPPQQLGGPPQVQPVTQIRGQS